MPNIGEVRGRGGGDYGFEKGVTILVLDRAAFARMNLPGGMTYSWCRKLGVEITELAKAKLIPGHGLGPTGHLRDSIDWSRTPAGEGVVVNVRATARYAVFVHEGTVPHRIEAEGKALVFHGSRDGKKLVFKRGRGVNHPGNRSNPFLRDSMNEVLIANGITI